MSFCFFFNVTTVNYGRYITERKRPRTSSWTESFQTETSLTETSWILYTRVERFGNL